MNETVRVDLYEFGGIYFTCRLEQLLENLNTVLIKVPPEFRHCVKIESGTEDGGDYFPGLTRVFYDRPETTEETLARKSKLALEKAKRIEKNEADERVEYERLKRKFEAPERKVQ